MNLDIEGKSDELRLSPHTREIQFVVTHLKEESLDELPALISQICQVGRQHGRCVAEPLSSIVLFYFGYPYVQEDSIARRRDLVAHLLAEKGSGIRIVHGQCCGLAGTFGAGFYTRIGVIIPSLSTLLERLLASEFGTATELS